MMRDVKFFAGAAFGAAALSLAVAALAQTASKGIYSKAQAERGAALYAETCARCHGPSMEGLDVAPPLTGGLFLGNWSGQPVAALAARIRTTMPLDQPGTLGLAASAELTAVLLAANGYPTGPADMPTGAAALRALTIDAPPGK
jgi:mono/diheme cytochrome c family protein